ncbi:hypothetical protein AX774_g4016 [Zancudomyces culisetae]|uniref:Uncharacterized protein n=1 Tax=Zancudomyces culisetae TaxID=1213189 RepID=A0A1R1PNF1_ZANCU|nr:hypothetical protein AX774_g4016 [Zancudomyces culisetae]|eukprot:OMH82489.1 hypothetical protein AX774_g4016 [Zancudomyces culisetae]
MELVGIERKRTAVVNSTKHDTNGDKMSDILESTKVIVDIAEYLAYMVINSQYRFRIVDGYNWLIGLLVGLGHLEYGSMVKDTIRYGWARIHLMTNIKAYENLLVIPLVNRKWSQEKDTNQSADSSISENGVGFDNYVDRSVSYEIKLEKVIEYIKIPTENDYDGSGFGGGFEGGFGGDFSRYFGGESNDAKSWISNWLVNIAKEVLDRNVAITSLTLIKLLRAAKHYSVKEVEYIVMQADEKKLGFNHVYNRDDCVGTDNNGGLWRGGMDEPNGDSWDGSEDMLAYSNTSVHENVGMNMNAVEIMRRVYLGKQRVYLFVKYGIVTGIKREIKRIIREANAIYTQTSVHPTTAIDRHVWINLINSIVKECCNVYIDTMMKCGRVRKSITELEWVKEGLQEMSIIPIEITGAVYAKMVEKILNQVIQRCNSNNHSKLADTNISTGSSGMGENKDDNRLKHEFRNNEKTNTTEMLMHGSQATPTSLQHSSEAINKLERRGNSRKFFSLGGYTIELIDRLIMGYARKDNIYTLEQVLSGEINSGIGSDGISETDRIRLVKLMINGLVAEYKQHKIYLQSQLSAISATSATSSDSMEIEMRMGMGISWLAGSNNHQPRVGENNKQKNENSSDSASRMTVDKEEYAVRAFKIYKAVKNNRPNNKYDEDVNVVPGNVAIREIEDDIETIYSILVACTAVFTKVPLTCSTPGSVDTWKKRINAQRLEQCGEYKYENDALTTIEMLQAKLMAINSRRSLFATFLGRSPTRAMDLSSDNVEGNKSIENRLDPKRKVGAKEEKKMRQEIMGWYIRTMELLYNLNRNMEHSEEGGGWGGGRRYVADEIRYKMRNQFGVYL